MNTRAWISPAVFTVSVGAAAALLAAGGHSPLRTAVAIWFLVVCPGLAIVPLLRIPDPWGELALVVSLSIALDLIVATALMYAGASSTAAAFGVLAAVSMCGAALQLRRGSARA